MRIVILLCFMFNISVVCAQSDVNFSGTLVQEPCTLAPESSDITVDFRSVILPYLYVNSHSPRTIFRIHLLDCDLSLGTLASVQFLGQEDAQQPGLLALGEDSQAQGVAIGIETLKGETIKINQSSKQYNLSSGDSILYFSSYVQASPEAKLNKSIVVGPFSAIVTFEIAYE